MGRVGEKPNTVSGYEEGWLRRLGKGMVRKKQDCVCGRFDVVGVKGKSNAGGKEKWEH